MRNPAIAYDHPNTFSTSFNVPHHGQNPDVRQKVPVDTEKRKHAPPPQTPHGKKPTQNPRQRPTTHNPDERTTIRISRTQNSTRRTPPQIQTLTQSSRRPTLRPGPSLSRKQRSPTTRDLRPHALTTAKTHTEASQASSDSQILSGPRHPTENRIACA